MIAALIYYLDFITEISNAGSKVKLVIVATINVRRNLFKRTASFCLSNLSGYKAGLKSNL